MMKNIPMVQEEDRETFLILDIKGNQVSPIAITSDHIIFCNYRIRIVFRSKCGLGDDACLSWLIELERRFAAR